MHVEKFYSTRKERREEREIYYAFNDVDAGPLMA
jgi:hypothetical protein